MKVSFDNLRNIITGKGEYYKTRSRLDYPYFKQHFIKSKATDLVKTTSFRCRS